MTFLTLELNPLHWEIYERICMIVLLTLAFLIQSIIETSKSFFKKDTTNDEIIESYKENKKRC